MAVTVTTVLAGKNMFIADIEATADGDTVTANIAHGLGATPLDFSIVPLATAASISLWRLTTKDATNLVLTKSTTANSGVAGVQVRIIARRPHSIVQ